MIQPYKYNKVSQLPCDNDIQQYTDIDLFQILDLNNPTDRELEAKLYTLIDKYHTIKNNVGHQMKNFYISIFKHFFETEEEEEYDENKEEEKVSLLHNTNENNNTRIGNLKEGFVTAETKTNEPTQSNQSNNNQSPTYTKNVDYTRGSLNPILKETIKRVVSIDSSFRNTDTYPISTEFTFNLTETLHDVVSLKLYSVSIPYNWYTINQNFGSNFFYIKGISNGIDNLNFEYKIDINYGLYSDVNLISTVNDSMKKNFIEKNSDISFGETKIEHSTINGRCTFTMDIKNTYNETNYYLNFPKLTYTNTDISLVNPTKNSIPELLGYTKKSYYPFTVYSNEFTPDEGTIIDPSNGTITTYGNNNQYFVNTTNNYFEVEIYKVEIQNERIPSYLTTTPTPPIISTIKVVLETINNVPITVTGSSFTGTQIYNELNRQLASHPQLINSIQTSSNQKQISSLIQAVKFIDLSFNIDSRVYVFELSVRPNRKNTANIPNQKMIIKFPNETSTPPVWTGSSSLFRFPTQIMEFQNIEAEVNSSTTSYLVNTRPYILLRCITNGFYTNNPPIEGGHPNGSYIATDLSGTRVDVNDYKIDIPNSSSTGYILTEYYEAIQNAMNQLDKGQITGTISNNINNNTSIDFNINKQITSENFYIDTTGSFLNTLLGFQLSLDGGFTYTTNTGYQNILITSNNNTFQIKSKTNNTFLTNCTVTIIPNTYNPTTLQNAIFAVFKDFSKNNIYLSTSSFICKSTENGRTIQTTFNLDIRAKLTNKDYRLYFFDVSSILIPPTNETPNIQSYNVYYYASNSTIYANSKYNYNWKNITTGSETIFVSTNSWGNYFGFENFSYSLADASGVNISVTGTKQNTTNALYLTDENNTFELIPIYDALGGVYNIKNSNDPAINNVISFKIRLDVNKSYSKKDITTEMNELFQLNELTRGSYINAETQFTIIRLNINKIFTTKDYSLIFYDVNSFTRCNYGLHSSAQVTTVDTTLGWKMGFRSNTFYNTTPENVTTNVQDNSTYYGNNIANSYTYDTNTNIATLMGDTSVNVNLYNYFLIVLDDYTQNHLNDGLITTTIAETDVPLPSYASKASRKCIVPINKEGVSNTNSYSNTNSLTNAQVYSANQVLSTKMNKYSKNIFSNGPFAQDIFGMIPIKTAGLSPGQTYSEFGGTLQIQERVYFGPVNISRMTVRIITDKGNVLDLNNQNWAFSLITEQLYNPNKG